jgi:inosine-uridine nucleoside N-ribohydrolase
MKPRILLDTDLNTDCGDAGAIALLHALADLGEADIIGIGVSVSNPDSPRALAAINRYYGRTDLPIGQYQGQPPIELHDGHPFVGAMSQMFTEIPAGGWPDTTALYRRALAAQPDQSVTVVAIGFHNTLQLLLDSPPDDISPLPGIDLVRARVKQLVVMGGQYPDSADIAFFHKGAEYNFYRCPVAARYVCERWPSPIVFTGFELGNTIFAGRTLVEKTPPNNPVRVGYEVARHPAGRHAWDETAILYGVRGSAHNGLKYFDEVHGTNHVNAENGANYFVEGPGSHRYLKKAMPDEAFSILFDALQEKLPKKTS